MLLVYCKLQRNVCTYTNWWHVTLNSDCTSRWPLKAAWWRLVRPDRSETFTLVKSGMINWAQLTALLAAATWSGVCQFLSRALTSAWCRSNTSIVSCIQKCQTSTIINCHQIFNITLFPDLVLLPISQHSVWSELTSHNPLHWSVTSLSC